MKDMEMEYEVQQDRTDAASWRVESIDYKNDGDCYVALFMVRRPKNAQAQDEPMFTIQERAWIGLWMEESKHGGTAEETFVRYAVARKLDALKDSV